MKTIKQVTAILLALLLVLGMSITAFAEETGNGSLKITNAEIGKSYTVYKVLDATYTGEGENKAVSYSTKNATLIAKIKEDATKAVPAIAQAGTVCPYGLEGNPDKDGRYSVVRKSGFTPELSRGWEKNNVALFTEFSKTIKCESGNVVEFKNIPYGLYLMVPGDGQVASVTTVAPSVEIVDKNERTPSGIKKVSASEGKAVAIGDVIDYSVSFVATNYYTISNATLNKAIDQYIVEDIAVGVGNLTVDSVRYYTKDEDPADPTKGTEIAKYSDSNKNGYTLATTSQKKDVVITTSITNKVDQITNKFTIP